MIKMDRISTFVDGGLQPISAWFQKMEKKMFSVGMGIDHYIDKQTPRKKYIWELSLQIPFVFILHQFCLVAPYSNNLIVNCVLIILWILASLLVIGAFHLNVRTRLRLYLLLGIDITIAWITLINYWTFQQESYEVCQEVNIILWTDIVNTYRLPGILTILIRGLYIVVRFKDMIDIPNLRLVLSATLIPDILCVIDLFPVFMSELSYWLHVTVFMAAFIIETLEAQELDFKITEAKVNELREMAKKEGTDSLRKGYTTEANALAVQLRLRKMGTGNFLRKHIPGQWMVRDCLFVCAVLYFGTALIAELILYLTSMYELMDIDFVSSVIGKWCTSIVTLTMFAAFLTCVTNLCLGCSIFFLTTEEHIAAMMNSNTGGIIFVSTMILFSESNVLNLEYTDKINAVKIVMFFSFHIILYQILNVIERKVRYVMNAGVAQEVSFFLRFGIVIGLFVTVPTLTTYHVSQNLQTEFLSLFFAVGNHLVIVVALLLVVECVLVSIKWRTIQYRTKLEGIIRCFCFFKNMFGLISCILVQTYFRFLCPYFKAWWFYRLILVCTDGGLCIIMICNSEWQKYKERKGQIELINNLPDVHYERNDDENERQDCSICFSEIIDGKILPCAHSFHGDCLQHWFRVRQVCPVCNSEVRLRITDPNE